MASLHTIGLEIEEVRKALRVPWEFVLSQIVVQVLLLRQL